MSRSYLLPLVLGFTSGFVGAQQAPSAVSRMNEIGPENGKMAERVGTWDVIETVWASAGAIPTSNKFVAVRKTVGPFLEETMQPAADSSFPDFRRVYFLSFNRVEGRWKYVSIDTRNPVGLMPGASFRSGDNGRFSLTFEPFSLAGSGESVSGQMLRMEEDFTEQDANHDSAQERFIIADGSGKEWLAYQYDYIRRLPIPHTNNAK